MVYFGEYFMFVPCNGEVFGLRVSFIGPLLNGIYLPPQRLSESQCRRVGKTKLLMEIRSGKPCISTKPTETVGADLFTKDIVVGGSKTLLQV